MSLGSFGPRYSALVSVSACSYVSGGYMRMCRTVCRVSSYNSQSVLRFMRIFMAFARLNWMMGCCCLVVRLLLPGTVFYLRNWVRLHISNRNNSPSFEWRQARIMARVIGESHVFLRIAKRAARRPNDPISLDSIAWQAIGLIQFTQISERWHFDPVPIMVNPVRIAFPLCQMAH